jgi:hypothetical protein
MASLGNPVPGGSIPSDTHAAAAATERPPAASLKDWRATDELFQKWQRRARESQYAHYEAAKVLTRANYGLGIPVTIFSTLVGTTVYATLQKQVDVRIQILIGSISVLTAILAGVQTFLRYGERAEKHRAIAASYGEARRTIESTAALPIQFRPPLNEFINQIERRLDDLSRSAPNVSDRIFARGLHQMKITAERHAREAVSAGAVVVQAAQGLPQDPYI